MNASAVVASGKFKHFSGARTCPNEAVVLIKGTTGNTRGYEPRRLPICPHANLIGSKSLGIKAWDEERGLCASD